jgi:hypothetical protein
MFLPKIKNSRILNSKGFNMFSILVAAGVLMAGLILTSMLIDTEDKISSQVYTMTNNFGLSDVASIAKADAIQSFNYSFREMLEDYLTSSPSQLTNKERFNLIKTTDLGPDIWDNVKNNFEESVLLSGSVGAGGTGDDFEKVINRVAEKTIDQLQLNVAVPYGRYQIFLSENDSEEAKKALSKALNDTVKDNIGSIKFFEVVGCESGINCPIGTFYFIIPLDKMKDEAYEALPRLVVKDTITQEEIQTPILPKTRLYIYIPIRFFKAISESIKNAEALAELENQIYRGDRGKAMLGYCDGGCAPRDNPLKDNSGERTNKSCTANVSLSPNFLGVSYYPVNNTIGTTALTAFARKKLCDEGINFYGGWTELPNFSNYNYNDSSTGRGLEGMGIYTNYTNCPFDYIVANTSSEKTKDVGGTPIGGDNKLYCSTIKKIYANVVWEDTDPQYLVTNTKNYFSIGIEGVEFIPESGISGTCDNTGTAGGTGSCKT